ncbi:hypothetical protein K503DRAFT_783818 [Rhizopogon vinicolor AM-OR11-026]|uniref:Uncharacterized protein n=1 Tax=Rhizopogon vinicolor AM-OR11-026 TaxID=1314800 RepID=A0A1B7MX13_9AGAM|nr:hypothetical protein K503DRAFT_783818 [Rhizopogon vinicolor AM-OR11-026]
MSPYLSDQSPNHDARYRMVPIFHAAGRKSPGQASHRNASEYNSRRVHKYYTYTMHRNDFENERLVDWLSFLLVSVSWASGIIALRAGHATTQENKVSEFVTRCNIGTKELSGAHQCVANDVISQHVFLWVCEVSPERPRARLSDGVTLNSGDLAATKATTPVAQQPLFCEWHATGLREMAGWNESSPSVGLKLLSGIPGVPIEGVVARPHAKCENALWR